MDPSALIFVALAVAWAVYLIPKALEHHEESVRTRTVDRFSRTMRVLARREPVSRRKAQLVRPGVASTETRAAAPAAPAVPETPEQLRARRRAAARAAKRRLRVVTLILLANAVVVALAAFSVVGWVWCAVPVGVLVAWLVACRLMVKRERAALPAARIPAETVAPAPTRPHDVTEEHAPVDAPVADGAGSGPDPDAWDPVHPVLPTYVSKPVARRTVSQIDLDSTGVWSSGRNASDSALAREADAERAEDRTERDPERGERRASGA